MFKYWVRSVCVWMGLVIVLNLPAPLMKQHFGVFWVVMYMMLVLIGLLFAGKLANAFRKNEDVFEGMVHGPSITDVLDILWLIIRFLFYSVYAFIALPVKGREWLIQNTEPWLAGISAGYWLIIIFLLL